MNTATGRCAVATNRLSIRYLTSFTLPKVSLVTSVGASHSCGSAAARRRARQGQQLRAGCARAEPRDHPRRTRPTRAPGPGSPAVISSSAASPKPLRARDSAGSQSVEHDRRSLLTEVTRRRASALPSAEAASGFTANESMRSAISRRWKRACTCDPRSKRSCCLSTNSAPRAHRRHAQPCRAIRIEAVPSQQLSPGHQRAHLRVPPRRPLGTAVQHRSFQPHSVGWRLDADGHRLQSDRRRSRSRAGSRAGTDRVVLRGAAAAARRCVGWSPRGLDGGLGRLHPVRRSRAGDGSASQAGGRMVDQLPQPDRAGMDLRRPMAVARRQRRRNDTRIDAEAGRVSSTTPSRRSFRSGPVFTRRSCSIFQWVHPMAGAPR